MKKIKYLISSLFLILMFPVMVDAMTFELKKVKSDKNEVAYDVILKLEEGDEPLKSHVLKIYNENEDLTYKISSNYVSDGMDCSLSSCPLIFATEITEVGKENVIASINVLNETTEAKETTLTIDGYDSSKKVFTVSALATTPTTTTTTTTTQKVLSGETNLTNLTVSVGEMDQVFSNEITTYNVTGIKDTVNSVTINPTCENNCKWTITCPLGECSVSNSKRVSLQTGANKVSITVTSEDGKNNKSYVLNIYRGEIETSSAYLSDIKIEDIELSPKFDSMTNDYTATVGLDVEKLEIDVIAEDPEAKVVIKGNDNLVEGENTVTITVTSSDGENKQVYTIIVTKEEIEEETVEEDDDKEVVVKPVEKKKNNLWLIIVISVLAIGAITTTAILIFRKKKNKNDKNNKNNKNGGMKVDNSATKLFEENSIEKENTESLNILDETRKQMQEEPKQDIDEALDDLMKTKRLELGDLGL